MDKARAFIADLRQNYDNGYWWADHPALRMALIGVITGCIGLLFVILECKARNVFTETPDRLA